MSTSDLAVSVRGLSKSYNIVHAGEHYRNPVEAMVSRLKQPVQRQDRETFWALKDVSFDVKKGEVVGIIGRNGAGKSTLLKIMSQITEPTAGEIRLYGRVGSLLEVGTGFHPELTGRENVYLNGAILGMKRSEIARQFDAIVDFAGVEQFLNTPVKRYSSGMYVRLAFAVAAHLNPEILIIDEVLAVGDAQFQKKCLGKMSEVAREGRTVLFVSHQLDAVRRLCRRCLLVDAGEITDDLPSNQAIARYLSVHGGMPSVSDNNLRNRLDRTSGAARFESVVISDSQGRETLSFGVGESVTIRLLIQTYKTLSGLGLYLAFCSGPANEAVTSIKASLSDMPIDAGRRLTAIVELPELNLRPGEFRMYICLGDSDCSRFYDVLDENVNLPPLEITSSETDPHKVVGYFSLQSTAKLQG